MKHLNYILASALTGVALASCSDLDTEYLGQYVTDQQKALVLNANPEMAVAGVTSMSSVVNQYSSVYEDAHFDFGYPAIMLGLDCQGNDMMLLDKSYNVHFNYWYKYNRPTNLGIPTNMMWRTMYNQIFTANAMLNTITNPDDPEQKFFMAQALGFRAFDYWNLIQVYQFNYVGHENEPGVPLITNENSDKVAIEGCPRSTVQEVYDLILSDLNTAIDAASTTSVTAEKILSNKPRRMLNLDALYGLRARVYLTMHKYAEAAADAKKAIEVSNCTPLSIAEASKPGFNSLDTHNWMWGLPVAETDRVVTTGICNWGSMACTFAYGYVGVGAWKSGSRNMVEALPVTDIRRGWFVDENLESPILTQAQQDYVKANGVPPYCNVKFDSYNGVLNQSTNATDMPYMRIEEMYYILAEGLAMSGKTGEAVEVLTNFEKTYRNPEFTTTSTSAQDIQELVYQRRRVEFWGEGLSYFDLQRLNKTIDRRNDNFPAAVTYVIPADDIIRIYVIPQKETTGNKQISVDQANKPGTSPTPQQAE